MKSSFIFITSYVYLFVCLSNVNGLQCNGSHEEIKCVQLCPPEKSCLNKDIYFKCSDRQEKCQLKCVCENGYYRDTTGECVTNETCESKCPGPNEFYNCGVACDNVCETLHIMNQTHCPILNIKCNEMCYCKEGYARDANKICVPFKECQPSMVKQDRRRRNTSPTKEPLCGLNEKYKACTCPPDTCMTLLTKFKCGPCEPGCGCRSGYLRKRADASCQPMLLCHAISSNPHF